MDKPIPFPDGGYCIIHGVFPYPAGVAAQPGFVIAHRFLPKHTNRKRRQHGKTQ